MMFKLARASSVGTLEFFCDAQIFALLVVADGELTGSEGWREARRAVLGDHLRVIVIVAIVGLERGQNGIVRHRVIVVVVQRTAPSAAGKLILTAFGVVHI